MKILMISTDDISGGAARAAYRLHKGLIQIGEGSRMLVRHEKKSIDQAVHQIQPWGPLDNISRRLNSLYWIIQQHISQNRTNISNTLFSFPYPGFDISKLPLVQLTDIINLHWVDRFQSPVTLRKLFDLKKPVVWTLHDEWAFTGGCHYTAGCMGYKNDCSNCPQLSDNLFDVTAVVLEDKLKLFADINLTIVTPSHWLSSCAKKSKLFKKFRVETIPYSIETDLFAPISKEKAKQKLGISENVHTILFSAELGNEKRKGFSELMQAIDVCLKDSRFNGLVKGGLIKLICLGIPSDGLAKLPIDTISLGYLQEDKKISEVYSAADIFILPTLEDNLPNTMLESMSCGTPVVAFETGGIPDVIEDNVTGKLVPFMDTKQMGEAILDLIFDPEKRVQMGVKCRKKMGPEFDLTVQAKNYKDLYKDLLEKAGTSTFKTKQDTEKLFFANTQELSVKLNTTVGPALQNSNDNILTKMLLKAYYRQISDRQAFIKNIKKLFSRLTIALLRRLRR